MYFQFVINIAAYLLPSIPYDWLCWQCPQTSNNGGILFQPPPPRTLHCEVQYVEEESHFDDVVF